MKRFVVRTLGVLAVAALCAGSAGAALAAINGAPLPQNAKPVLVTRVGQARVEAPKEARTFPQKKGGERVFKLDPQASDLVSGGFKTLVFMVGSYAVPGSNVPGDLARLSALLDKARAMGVKVVVMHLEGPKAPKNNPTLDTREIDMLLKYANNVVVMKSGNAVNARMAAVAQQNGIALSTLDSVRDLRPAGAHGRLRMKNASAAS